MVWGRTVWVLIKRAAIKWSADDCLTLGAALAYYTVFSLAPILVIAIAVAGALFGQEAAQGEIVGQIRSGWGGRRHRDTRRARRLAARKPSRWPISSARGPALG